MKIENQKAMQTFFNLVHGIATGYHDHPYHGFDHAVDTIYIAYWMLTECRAGMHLGFSPLQNLALLLAALTHDVLHPGYNNFFLNATDSVVSKKYSFQSPLEKQSCDYFFELLNEFPIMDYIDLPGYSKEDADKALRAQVYSCLMQTDITYHLEQLNFLKKIIEEHYVCLPLVGKYDLHGVVTNSSGPQKDSSRLHLSLQPINNPTKRFKSNIVPGPDLQTPASQPPHSYSGPSLSLTPLQAYFYKPKLNTSSSRPTYMPLTKDQVSFFVGVILHAADISNAARPYYICKRWSDRVCQEFYNQGDKERELNLPISQNMDRNTTRGEQVALEFSRLLVRPYYEVLAVIIPAFIIFFDYIAENEVLWRVKSYITENPSADKYEKVDKLIDLFSPKGPSENRRSDSPRLRSSSMAAGLFEILKDHKSCTADGRFVSYPARSSSYLYIDYPSHKPYSYTVGSILFHSPSACYLYSPDPRRRCLSLSSVLELPKNV